jgi:beta-carotene hydroxylase
MNTPHLRLTRRNADLPTLEALDAGLRHSGILPRIVAAVLPIATLGAFFVAWQQHAYWLLVPIMLAQFISTVAFLHDVAHGSAGLNAKQTHAVLFAMGVLMLQSGHAFRYSHLFHHTHCLEHDDLEGAPACMDLWHVLLAGPGYLPALWRKAVREAAPRERRWILVELTCAAGMAATAVWASSWSFGPLLYCALVYAGSWAYPLTTAYLAHYKPGNKPLEKARTVRGALVPALFMNLTYHLEHHLYPQVPSTNLRRLALRLDPLLAARGLKLPAPLFF